MKDVIPKSPDELLKELYFVEPDWLRDAFASVISWSASNMGLEARLTDERQMEDCLNHLYALAASIVKKDV